MVEERPFHIGELAERTELSRDAIRHYERAGVLPPARRTSAGCRVYGADDVKRIEVVGQARAALSPVPAVSKGRRLR